MSDDETEMPRDEAGVREDGQRVGTAAGKRAAGRILVGLDMEQARAVGADELTSVVARADAMLAAGHRQEVVAAWTAAVADAFSAELASVVTLLKARASGSKH